MFAQPSGRCGSFPSSSSSRPHRKPTTAASCRPGYTSLADACICRSAIPKPRCCQSAAPPARRGRLFGHKIQGRPFHGLCGRVDPQAVQTRSQLLGSDCVITLMTHVVFCRLGNRQQDRPMVQRFTILPQPTQLFLKGFPIDRFAGQVMRTIQKFQRVSAPRGQRRKVQVTRFGLQLRRSQKSQVRQQNPGTSLVHGAR